ncbi:hypothetical protein [Fluviispira sanaruensis]|uniref:Uncharacterized protein n=1 Tax=Fluviispira sanaruensis TaxID=2493639 RepID=A0A4P2VNR2_FLUSA|nr:hypothetical protein [Fluviispira sanaruensis]BBH54711.1 hypothetical protein JCM31447_31850 [Fluviispira sanaruensis]
MKTKKNENKGRDRVRINLSMSLKDDNELAVILINRNRYELKVNNRMTLSGPSLLKYLINNGLKELNKKYGEIDWILKKERILDEK